MKSPGIKLETLALEALSYASVARYSTGHDSINSDGMLFWDNGHDAKASPGSDKKSKPNLLVRLIGQR